MAHQFILQPDGFVLSSNLGQVIIRPDGNFADVRLVADNGAELLSERYYAYERNNDILDLGSLIEDYMRSARIAIQGFRLQLISDNPEMPDATAAFSVIFCDRTFRDPYFQPYLAENFLTTLDTRRVPQDFVCLSFNHFSRKGESIFYRLRIDYRVTGSDELLRYTALDPNGDVADADCIEQVDLFRENLVADIAKTTRVKDSDISLVSLTLRLGQRSMTYYFDPSLRNADTFYFFNCFNVIDFITLPSETKAKTDVDRSMALLNGRAQFYDQSTTESFEVETGPLTDGEASLMSQLVSSHRVMLDSGEEYPIESSLAHEILITDSTIEVSNTDEKPNTAKFTWRYADKRPVIQMPTSPGIFTDPYNLAYS